MSHIYFDTFSVSLDSLEHYPTESLLPYQKRVLEFCRRWQAGEPQFTIQTSGSTGAPKKLVLKRQQLEASARMTIRALSLKAGQNALVCINTDYIGGKMMLIRGMECGMDLIIREPSSDPSKNDVGPIGFMALVPRQVQALLESDRGRAFLSACPTVIIGGAPLDPRTELQLSEFDNHIYETFGMTETVSHFALRLLSRERNQSYFQVLKGIEIAQDHRGCLVVNGAVTSNHPVVTNDRVELLAPDRFVWIGRQDQVINSGGHKVYPPKLKAPVIKALKQNGLACNFVITGTPDAQWGERVTLVLESNHLNEEVREQILQQLREVLHPYELPRTLITMERLPRTHSDKVDMIQLRQQIG